MSSLPLYANACLAKHETLGGHETETELQDQDRPVLHRSNTELAVPLLGAGKLPPKPAPQSASSATAREDDPWNRH